MTDSATDVKTYRDVEYPVRSQRKMNPLRILTLAILIVVLADFIAGVINNERLSWSVVGEYLFSSEIIAGLGMTLWLTFAGMFIGTVLGLVLAVMALSANPVLRAVSNVYILIFRSIPQLVQLLFWYFLAAIAPTVGIGLPFMPDFLTFDSTKLITQVGAALLGLGLSEAAYLSEYFRAGILSVPAGQTEAAMACGLTPTAKFWRVVAPQAVRIIIPAYGNSLVSLLENTSIVFVIGAGELLTRAQLIYSQNYQQIPLLIVVSIWYVALVSIMMLIQKRIEARFSRGYSTLSASSTS